MKKSLLAQSALMVLFALLLLWTVPATAADPAKDTVKNVYICGCGPACACNMVAEKPANCPCGKPLIEKQVLKEDADKVYVCACPDNCKCGPNPADPAKCACGKELRAYPKDARIACAKQGQPAGCDKPCAVKPCAEKPCCAKPAAEAK